MSQDLFVIRHLMSRGGLSVWTLFVYPDRVTMIDHGMGAAFKAGFLAGARVNCDDLLFRSILRHIEARQEEAESWRWNDLDAWCADLKFQAKRVIELDDRLIRGVRLEMQATYHQLYFDGVDGVLHKLRFTKPREAAHVEPALAARFGPRFECSMTKTLAFLRRHAPPFLR